MKQKIKYLEDRVTTMEKSLSRINNILGRFQMTENQEQGFKDITSKDNGNELIYPRISYRVCTNCIAVLAYPHILCVKEKIPYCLKFFGRAHPYRGGYFS
jgi:hypothetical protein